MNVPIAVITDKKIAKETSIYTDNYVNCSLDLVRIRDLIFSTSNDIRTDIYQSIFNHPINTTLDWIN